MFTDYYQKLIALLFLGLHVEHGHFIGIDHFLLLIGLTEHLVDDHGENEWEAIIEFALFERREGLDDFVDCVVEDVFLEVVSQVEFQL